MKSTVLVLSLVICLGAINAQEVDTFSLHVPISNNDTIIYKRLIHFEKNDSSYHVRDYFPNGQIQMEGTYSSFDKRIKEESLWCNYMTNTKEGEFKVWYEDGQIKSKTPLVRDFMAFHFKQPYTKAFEKQVR